MKKMKLSQGKYAMVDDEDYEWLNKYKWSYNKGKIARTGRAFRNDFKNKKIILMHRKIMKTPKGLDCDHINGNGIDNRKSNLRNCTHRENSRNKRKQYNNKSGYKGVHFNKLSKKWQAMICVNNKNIYLGLFKDKKSAGIAYNNAAIEYYGKYAKLNKV